MDEFNKNIENIRLKTINNIESILAKGALICSGLAKENLIANHHYVTGALAKHTTGYVEGLKLEFGNNLDYASTIETGIVTEAVSSNSIKTWLDNKISLGHIPKSMSGLQTVIANKINSTGRIKNFNPFMKPSWDEMVIVIDPLLKDSLVQE